MKRSLRNLKELPQVKGYADNDEAAELLLINLEEFFSARKKEGAEGFIDPFTILAIDDYDLFYSQVLKEKIAHMGRNYHPFGFSIILAIPSMEIYRGSDSLRQMVLSNYSGFLLCPSISDDFQIFRLPSSLGSLIKGMPKGRGFYISRSQNKGIVQTFLFKS
jgi:hypothetical protein